jgi:hypothetical protein
LRRACALFGFFASALFFFASALFFFASALFFFAVLLFFEGTTFSSFTSSLLLFP